jgi:23S rRNA G2445 N2-methylase RlmL
LPPAEAAAAGLIRLTAPVAPEGLIARLRWSYGIRIEVASAIDGSVATLFAGVRPIWQDWFQPPADGVNLTYRFSVEGRKLPPPEWGAALNACRAALLPFGLVDDPSAYVMEFVVSLAGDNACLYLRPTFEADNRFAYRLSDVGASMNPVVAAALANLIASPLGGTALDPTCGSGTLLVERARIDNHAALAGIDASPTAVKAAKTNLKAAGLMELATIRQGDAMDPASWVPCKVVLVNLPFGLRTAREGVKPEILYAAICGNIANFMEPGGRALLATTQLKALDAALRKTPRLSILARCKVQTGGLWLHIVVLGN